MWGSVDPQKQFASPYMAMGNNPVIGVDPDGEFFFFAILGPVGAVIDGALWGAVIGGATYTAVTLAKGGDWTWKGFLRSTALGALSGAVTAGIGQVFGHGLGTFMNELGRAFAHGWAQGTIAFYTGNAEGMMGAFATGALSSLAGSAFQKYGGDFATNKFAGAGFSGVVGGITAEANGGDFWKGFGTGATIALANHYLSTWGDNIVTKLRVKQIMKKIDLSASPDEQYKNIQKLFKLLRNRIGGVNQPNDGRKENWYNLNDLFENMPKGLRNGVRCDMASCTTDPSLVTSNGIKFDWSISPSNWNTMAGYTKSYVAGMVANFDSKAGYFTLLNRIDNNIFTIKIYGKNNYMPFYESIWGSN